MTLDECCATCCTFSPAKKDDIGKHARLVQSETGEVSCPQCGHVYRSW